VHVACCIKDKAKCAKTLAGVKVSYMRRHGALFALKQHDAHWSTTHIIVVVVVHKCKDIHA
jgi:hypothetical protein